MKTVCSINQCSGCSACVDACPVRAIVINKEINAYNAIIDEKLCINCGKCDRVCQVNNEVTKKAPLYWQQGWANSEEVRKKASSGGLATAVIRYCLDKNFIVCGCVFENGEFGFQFAYEGDSSFKFSGSKYVKSNPTGVYEPIKEYLKKGNKVLFVGLPCQIAAMKLYIGTDNLDNLYTIDLICHGTPSPKLLELFLKQYDYCLSDLKRISFRTKAKFNIDTDSLYLDSPGVCDRYTIAFLKGITYTENCYSCKYAEEKRVSDITLGDSWGSELVDEAYKGISLILCQTDKGKELLENVNINMFPVDKEIAKRNNGQLNRPVEKTDKREKLFRDIEKNKNFNSIIFSIYPWMCIKQIIKSILIRLGLWGVK